jgi:peptidoglycan/xylan/chitin deacetylase (PgdA/CDA1 family)
MQTVLWSVDPRDWVNGVTANQVVATVLSELHPGVIIDFHDGGGYQDATVAALPRIIETIEARGLEIVPVIP